MTSAEAVADMRVIKATAHGRVNLMGEHTDYNGGWVLPTLIPQLTEVRLKVRNDNEVHAVSDMESASPGFYLLGREKSVHSWLDYIQGTTEILRKHGFAVHGFDVAIKSTVPLGSGLSSSAALEVSMLRALRTAFRLDFNDIQLAQMGQKIENDFVGAHVGILDQMACALGEWGYALFLDVKNMTYERIPLPLDEVDLVIINSGVVHQHSNGDYNRRRAECEQACAALKITDLRELGMKDLPRLDTLDDVLKRRARHVVTENDRVHHAVDALRARDLKTLGRLFYESHASMRDDYEVSVDAVDQLVELFRKEKDIYGARLTGGGFGGSIVALAKKDKGFEIAHRVAEAFAKNSLNTPTVLTPTQPATKTLSNAFTLKE